MRAKKSLGQNFLRDESVVERIIDALDLQKKETVIEIGPGRGALTETLLARAGKVIAIEFDRDMVAVLKDRFDTLQIVEGDVLGVDFRDLAGAEPLKVVGNLPYNISTPILQRLMDSRELFSVLVLMFQREVVDRITAAAGNSDRGYLTVLTEAAFEVERLFDVPPTAFQPTPKVWSSVVRLRPKTSVSVDETFRRLVSVAFAQKRKTILNNLKSELNDAAALLRDGEIDPRRRAESLTLAEWFRLFEVVSASKSRAPDDARLGES
jgi:16S rRNA (adenine1518-N6/adenine1519-N6)-dimethyltransferase